MGQVANKFIKDMFSASDSEETVNVPEELTEIFISFNYKIECDNSYYEERKSALALVVAERNDLIHHLLPKWNINSFESTTEIEKYLDQQREKILPELELLKAYIKTMQELKKEFADFLASDEGTKQLELSFLRQSQLVAWLFNIAEQRSRPDGWVVLASAAQLIHQNIPQEITNLEKRYGYKKMKEIMLATEFFDINEELTDKGGIRVLYRIKPDLKFTD